MADIIKQNQLKAYISGYKISGEKIILVGGCFDILHVGHLKFLEESRKFGDRLIVFLESDDRVKKLKGENRPIFDQNERAFVLSSLNSVDLVVNLQYIDNDAGYEKIIGEIRPDIISITQSDPYENIKRKQAQRVNAKLKIIPFIKTYSSSKLAKILGIE